MHRNSLMVEQKLTLMQILEFEDTSIGWCWLMPSVGSYSSRSRIPSPLVRYR